MEQAPTAAYHPIATYLLQIPYIFLLCTVCEIHKEFSERECVAMPFEAILTK